MRTASAVLGVLAVTAASAGAQNHPDSLGWQFVGTAGYVQTSGNSRLSTVNLSDRLVFRPNLRWQFAQTAAWVYGRTGGVESANQLLARLRGDLFLSTRVSLFGFGGFERNRLAGVDSRLEVAGGMGWQAVRSERHVADLEAGASYNSQQSPATRLDAFIASRVAARYKVNIGGRSYAEQTVELLSNLEDTGDQRLLASTSLVAPISQAIGIRLSYLVRYDSEPALRDATTSPPAYFEKLDTTFSTGLQFTF